MLATLMVLSLRIFHSPMAALANLANSLNFVRIVSDVKSYPIKDLIFVAVVEKLVIVDVNN